MVQGAASQSTAGRTPAVGRAPRDFLSEAARDATTLCPSTSRSAPASHSPTKRSQSPLPIWDAERGWGVVTHRQLQLHHLPSVTRGDKGRKSKRSETPVCQLFVTWHGFIPFAHPQPKHPFAPASRTLSAQQTAFAVQVTTGSKPFSPPVCH